MKNTRITKFFHSSTLINTAVASVDQATLSALSFIIQIILIRHVSKVEYGYYSIAFTISLFILTIQNAVVNTPLAVLLVTKKNSERKNYAASLCYGQFLVIIPAVCFGLAVAVMLAHLGFDSTQVAIGAAVCFAAIGNLYREFFRAYFFAEQNSFKVLKIDTIYAILFLGAVALIYLLFHVSVAAIFIMIGICGLLASLVFSWQQNWKYNLESIKQSYAENWKYGKWALVGVIVTHIQSNGYLYMLGALLGSVAVADVSAARLLMMPLILVDAGYMKIAVPHGSRLREQNQLDRFLKEQVLVSMIYVLIVGIYLGVLISLSGLLSKLVFTQKYTDSFDYLPYWAVLFTIGFIGKNAGYGLQVMKKFDLIAKANFLTMLLTMGCAFVFIKAYGIKGGLTGLIIGNASIAIVLWFYFVKMVFLKAADRTTIRPQKIVLPKFLRNGTVPHK